MQCNIDAKGKRIRLIGGGLTFLLGTILLTWSFYAAIIVMLCGAFMIFEARAGWCALRAMGFRTKF